MMLENVAIIMASGSFLAGLLVLFLRPQEL
jgi:hypothetical protein